MSTGPQHRGMGEQSDEQRKMDRLEAENYDAYVAMGKVEL